MEVRLIDETQDVSIEFLGEGRYRVWIDAFHDTPPYHRANYWADVDRDGLIDLLEATLELPDYCDFLTLLSNAAPNTDA